MSPNPKARSSSASMSRANPYGNALRRGDLKISDPIPIPREADGLGQQVLPHTTGTWPRQSTPPPIEAFNNAQNVAQQAADPRISSFNTTASLSTGPSKTSLSKQKAGGFRATMKKMFGNRKKRDTITSIVEEPRRREALSFITTADPVNDHMRHQRVSSMPLQEVDRRSALGSHAPDVFDSNTLRPQQSPPRGSLDYHHKRRNTLSDNRGIFDREASSANEKLQSKRRSRSAGTLREIAAQQSRNRDDEIMYWRRSVVDSPIPTFVQSQENMPVQIAAAAGVAETTTDPDQPPVASDKYLHVMPSQTFDFGNLMGHNPEEDSVEQRIATLEVKIVDLELALTRLSGNDGTKGSVILGKPPGPKRPSQISHQSSYRSESSSVSIAAAKATASPEPTFLASPAPSSTPPPENQQPLPHRIHRTSAATTLRPSTAIRRSIPSPSALDNTSFPSPNGYPAPATLDHIEKLMILLQREQSHRHKLENQYKSLENQIEQLQRSPPYAHFKPSYNTMSSYPTPSPEDMTSSVNFSMRQSSTNSVAVKPPPPPRLHFHNSTTTTHGQPRHHEFLSHNRGDREVDSMSISTSTSSSRDESEEDDPYQEIYETPTESTHKFSALPDENVVSGDNRNMI